MTNWQVFEVQSSEAWESEESQGRFSGGRNAFSIINDIKRFDLDKYVEFADGYEKSIKVKGNWGSDYYRCGGSASSASAWNARFEFIEIDLDRTKLKRSTDYFENGVIKAIPKEVAIRRRMESVASADPVTLAIAREAMDRVDRGERTEFEYKIMDNSNLLHHLIYNRKK